MHFAAARALARLTWALTIASTFGAQPAYCQGLMEYGGLMALPKGLPGNDTIQNMTRSYGVVPNMIPGQTAPSIPAGISTTRTDGTVVVDQKKVKEITDRANNDHAQAQQLLAKTGATLAELKLAEKHLRDAITLRNSVWGYEDPAIPKLLNELGRTYERQKQPASAEACYQNAITYINKKYGLGSSERLDTFVNLAPLLVKDGKISDAISLQQQITLIKERRSGAQDIGTIQARLNWANSAKVLDKPNAPDIYKQCLVDIDKAGSNIAPDKVSKFKSEIFPSYIEVLKKQGREDEAKEAIALQSAAAAQSVPAGPGTAGSAQSAPVSAATGSPANASPGGSPAAPTGSATVVPTAQGTAAATAPASVPAQAAAPPAIPTTK